MSLAYQLVRAADQLLSGIQVGIGQRNGSLVTLFCHSFFENEREIEMDLVHPQEAITAKNFRILLDDFLDHGFKIASIEDLARGLDPSQRSLLLTFDDGYCNNQRAAPLLKEYDATAVIFLSANHVREGRPYWWDVLYRIRRGQGRSLNEINAECARLNTQKTEMIEEQVRASAPGVPFKTVSDLDRPLKPEEVKEMAATGRFYFENHTADHAVLSAYSPEEVFREIAEAQESIAQMTGRRPVAIAYPNGSHTSVAADGARKAGLKLGFSTVRRKEYAASWRNADRLMALGRFQPLGTKPLETQARYFQSDLMITQRLRELKQGL